jgi:mono/diheme cytochrome c family protein
MIGRTMRWTVVAMTLCLATTVAAQSGAPSAARGELLYKTHCVGCHTTQVHWRDRRLATDWNSLQTQVRRWQRNNGLKWGDQEIADVARYLNGEFYHFTPPARQAQRSPSRVVASAER